MSSFLKFFQLDVGERPYLGKEGCFRRLGEDAPVFPQKVLKNGEEKCVFTEELPQDVKRFSQTGEVTNSRCRQADSRPRSMFVESAHMLTQKDELVSASNYQRADNNSASPAILDYSRSETEATRTSRSLDYRKRWSVQPEMEQYRRTEDRKSETLPKLDVHEELRTKYGVTFHLPPPRPVKGKSTSGSTLSRKVVPALRVRSHKTDSPVKAKAKVHNSSSEVKTEKRRTPVSVDYIRPVRARVREIEANRPPELQDEKININLNPPVSRERRHSSATIDLVAPNISRPSETFVSRLELDLTKVVVEKRRNSGKRLRDIKRKDNVDFKKSSSTPASPRLGPDRNEAQRRSMRIYTSYSDIDGTTTISSCEVLASSEEDSPTSSSGPRLSSNTGRHFDFLKGSQRNKHVGRKASGERMDSAETQETLENGRKSPKSPIKTNDLQIIELDHELKSGSGISNSINFENEILPDGENESFQVEKELEKLRDDDDDEDNDEEAEVEETRNAEYAVTENGSIGAAVESGKGMVFVNFDSSNQDGGRSTTEEERHTTYTSSMTETSQRCTVLDRYREIQATYKKVNEVDSCVQPSTSSTTLQSEAATPVSEMLVSSKESADDRTDKSDSGLSSGPASPSHVETIVTKTGPAKYSSPGPIRQSSPKILKQDTPKSTDRSRPKSSVSFTSSIDDTVSNLSYNSFTTLTVERERAKLRTNGSFSPPSGRIRTEVEVHSLHNAMLMVGSESETSFRQGHSVVVAIDFGTTYSGYAFSYLQDPRNIHVMRKWDQGDPGVINQKTPTTLLLDPDGRFDSFGFAARDKYHNLIPCEAEKWLFFEKFKMMLHHDEGLNPTTTIRANNGSLWPALTIFAHALRFFKDHALRELSEQSAMRILNEDVRWVVTVPAIWKQPAKQFMRLAAYEAAIASPDLHDQLLIALEPEAASIYCRALKLYQLAPEKPVNTNKRISLSLSPRRRDSSFNLDEEPVEFSVAPSSPFPNYRAADSVDLAVGGTPYMVVDCGGGTVDITVHQLSQLDGKLKELATAVGSAHGSIDVDAEFERLLMKIFTEEFIKLFKENRPAGYVDLMIAFEARKRSASPFQDSSFNISIPFSFIDYYKKYKRRSFGTIPRRSLNSLQRRSFSIQDGAIAMETAVRKNKVKGVSWLSQLGMLRLSSEMMYELFEPALVEICSTIRSVLETSDARAVQYMFLVGGFAESTILQKRVRAEFEGFVKVVIPQGTALSILRGAVMYGLDPSVITHRKSRLTYGLAVLNRFDPAKHPQSKRVQIGQHTWCADVFDKFVKINQSVGLGDSVIREYSPAKQGQRSCVFNVYCTDRESVRFVTDRGVSRCGTMTLILPTTEATDAKRKVQMRMAFGDTEIKVTAVDLNTGQSANANVNFLCI